MRRMMMARAAAAGMTLIELLVAMTLALLLIGAMTALYADARRTYDTQIELARMQENARLAAEAIAREVRMAGHLGCAAGVAVTVSAASPPEAPTAALALRAYDDGAGWMPAGGVTRVAGSDVLRVIRAVPGRTVLASMAAADAALILAANNDSFAAKDRLIVSDCESADLFCASSVSGASVAHTTDCNSRAALSRAYAAGARVMAYRQAHYFVALNPARRAALYVQTWSGDKLGSAQEWVEGVEDMQVTLGLDNDLDGAVDGEAAPSAVADWARVRRVRVSFLLAGQQPVLDGVQTLAFAGLNKTFNDRRLRRVYDVEIALRNRLP